MWLKKRQHKAELRSFSKKRLCSACCIRIALGKPQLTGSERARNDGQNTNKRLRSALSLYRSDVHQCWSSSARYTWPAQNLLHPITICLCLQLSRVLEREGPDPSLEGTCRSQSGCTDCRNHCAGSCRCCRDPFP